MVPRDFDTVGVTILPGHPLPEWAEPGVVEESTALPADAGMAAGWQPAADAVGAAAVPASTLPADAAWGAAPSMLDEHSALAHQPVDPVAKQPAYAMAGASAYAIANPPPASEPASPAPDYAASPAAASPHASAATAVSPSAPANGAYSGVGGQIPPRWSDAPTAPATGQLAGTTTLPSARQPQPAQDVPTPMTAAGADSHATVPPTGTTPPAGGPGTPSTDWTSPDRPELSPEHVALLTWWAEMIAKGQFPPPQEAAASAPPTPERRGLRRRKAASSQPGEPEPGSASVASTAVATAAANAPAASPPPSSAFPIQGIAAVGAIPAEVDTASGAAARTLTTPPSRPTEGARSRRGPLLVGLGLGAVALTGLVIAFGPGLFDSVAGDETPAPVVPSTLTMPTAVGDLVVLTGAGVDEQLVPLVGLGLRPTGVTATGAYATSADAPLALAALASSLPAPASDAEQITAWASRTGATVGELVGGEGGIAGITCADATALTSGPDGAICVWTGTGSRGQTFVVATSAASALDTTATFRGALEGTTAPTS